MSTICPVITLQPLQLHHFDTWTYLGIEPGAEASPRVAVATERGYLHIWRLVISEAADTGIAIHGTLLFSTRVHRGSIEGLCWGKAPSGEATGAGIATATTDGDLEHVPKRQRVEVKGKDRTGLATCGSDCGVMRWWF